MTTARFVLAEDRAVDDALEQMKHEGVSIVRGWQLPNQPWDVSGRRIACAGRIASQADLEAALVAAARGAFLVIEGRVPVELFAAFVEDLRRLGTVEHRRANGLDAQQHRILTLLGEGLSIGEAAAQLFISRRTADRRLAAARSALGVRTNNEAVVALARHGSLDGLGSGRH